MLLAALRSGPLRFRPLAAPLGAVVGRSLQTRLVPEPSIEQHYKSENGGPRGHRQPDLRSLDLLPRRAGAKPYRHEPAGEGGLFQCRRSGLFWTRRLNASDHSQPTKFCSHPAPSRATRRAARAVARLTSDPRRDCGGRRLGCASQFQLTRHQGKHAALGPFSTWSPCHDRRGE